ncbi:Secretory carrier-associated membrane protein 3 [Saguinus oedipus]|uniref:Secretory carrier-associated membrane protein n=1 Tax=Saguinus oedipus TaxID=9490 RepID=A0ABQ9TI32_SAGOE|nr:Secretory carrier-associated membrane protein 3 [Saguinus oedipus]
MPHPSRATRATNANGLSSKSQSWEDLDADKALTNVLFGKASLKKIKASAAAATAELLKKQEELNRKAEELDRRERELQHAALGGTATRQNNWPPLPSFCPVQPCFFQDISMEIPQEFQKTVSTMYYLWMCE